MFKKGSCQLLVKECALSTGKLPRRLAQEVWIVLTDRARNDLNVSKVRKSIMQPTNQQNVFEHKIEVIMSWQICVDVLVPVWIPGVDITQDCLPENKF